MTLDLKTALLCAKVSSIAYIDPSGAADAALARLGLIKAAHFDHADVHALLAWLGPRPVLAFRGTEFDLQKIRDVIVNLAIDLEDFPLGGEVIRGYFHSVCEIWKDARELIGNVAPSALLITGHSMGGVEATDAGAIAFEEGRDPEVITFGAPKPGNAAFCAAIARMNLTRFVRERDFAPTHPPIGSFMQPGTEQWLHGGRIETIVARPGINESVEDHAIDKYAADINALVMA